MANHTKMKGKLSFRVEDLGFSTRFRVIQQNTGSCNMVENGINGND